MGEMSGNIAHDFNNILGTIMPSLQLAMHRSKDPDIHILLSRALQATKNGAAISRRLLSFARPQPDLEEDISVADVCNVVRDLAKAKIEDWIPIEILPIDRELTVHCDRARLETVLINLIFNARDAILADDIGGRIQLIVCAVAGTTEHGPHVEIAVSDNGPGMHPKVKARAMEPFFTTRTHGQGSGLGLSIAYGFCRQAGGSLTIRSEPGEGTTVTVQLNLLTKPKMDSVVATWLPGDGQRILIAEAEEGLRQSLSDVMTELTYDAVIVGSGEAALHRLRQADFDILLTDINMEGGMDGFTLAKAIRDIGVSIPVIYMSGQSVAADDSRLVVPGPVLRKPCDIGELSRVISASLGNGQQAADGT